MSTELTFTIPGEPASKARPRFDGRGIKGRTYTPAKTKAAEAAVALMFRSAGGKFEPDGEVTFGVEVTFFNGTRQRRDIDNMIKLVLDGLNGVAWVDDTQVTEVTARKRFVSRDEARTVVKVSKVGTMDRLRKPCAHCGTPLVTYESLKSRARYCSPKCRAEAGIKRRRRKCEQCGEEFLSHGESHQTRFCSRGCQSANGRTTIPCAICGTDFEQYKSWVKRRPYCSPECSAERAKRARSERRSQSFPGTCAICGAGTTRKEYRRCNPCKLAGKAVPS